MLCDKAVERCCEGRYAGFETFNHMDLRHDRGSWNRGMQEGGGIKPMGGNGHIRIRIGPEEGGRMKIQVRDNGVGIDALTLLKLQDYHKIWNIDIDVSGTGIVLIGTIQRIVLIYGEQASYQIRSVPEGGTEITSRAWLKRNGL